MERRHSISRSKRVKRFLILWLAYRLAKKHRQTMRSVWVGFVHFCTTNTTHWEYYVCVKVFVCSRQNFSYTLKPLDSFNQRSIVSHSEISCFNALLSSRFFQHSVSKCSNKSPITSHVSLVMSQILAILLEGMLVNAMLVTLE